MTTGFQLSNPTMTSENLMYRNLTIKHVLPIAVLLGLSGLLYVRGCRAEAKNFVPSSEVAHAAVKKALEAWQAGAMSGEIAGTKPLVAVTDVMRKPSQLLERFEILGETPGRTGRIFAVQLQLSKPIESIKTEYIVVGIDPLWVFRREDFELFLHWDHLPADGTK